VKRLKQLAENRAGTVGLALASVWALAVFGFYFGFKVREIWPKIVEVLGGG
jgi:hypothetical protein